MLTLAVEQFNQQDFYACHDTLEALWMESLEPDRTFYQGLLQMAVGLYHFHNGNQRGAMILLGEGMGRLQRYRPTYDHLNIDALLDQGQVWLAWLHNPEQAPQPQSLWISLDSSEPPE
jgi:predicted metal-dependent hydrolase